MLEYAQLLISHEGWNGQIKESGQPSTANAGWTLHDSIGEACRRLSRAYPGSEGSKDAHYQSVTGDPASLRAPAQQAVDAELTRMADAGDWTYDPATSARIDYAFNDQAQSVDEVIAVLTRAREAL